MDATKLGEMLEAHRKWIAGEGGSRLNLRGCNLSGCDISGCDLSGSNLSGSNLRGSNLSGCDLSGSNLSGCDLRGSNLSGCDLRYSDLSGSNLRYSDLSGSNLRGCNLSDSDLRDSDLSDSNLRGCDISGIDKARLTIVPESGSFHGWKKCTGDVLVHVEIPADARRSNATRRKCRAERVTTLEVLGADVGISRHDGKTEYRVGEVTQCDQWCEDRWVECGGGIHFFLTRAEAEAW